MQHSFLIILQILASIILFVSFLWFCLAVGSKLAPHEGRLLTALVILIADFSMISVLTSAKTSSIISISGWFISLIIILGWTYGKHRNNIPFIPWKISKKKCL